MLFSLPKGGFSPSQQGKPGQRISKKDQGGEAFRKKLNVCVVCKISSGIYFTLVKPPKLIELGQMSLQYSTSVLISWKIFPLLYMGNFVILWCWVSTYFMSFTENLCDWLFKLLKSQLFSPKNI
jgi:hypothetical protein